MIARKRYLHQSSRVAYAIDSPKANAKETKKFPSVIGMLLHVVRHLRHDCINLTKICSRFMSKVKKACVEHMNDMCEFMVKSKDQAIS